MNRGNPHGDEQFIAEMHRRQRNIVWPDAAINTKSVDKLAFKGSPDASLLQRIGILLFALTFIGIGATLVSQGYSQKLRLITGFGFGPILLGGWMVRNALRRRRRDRK